MSIAKALLQILKCPVTGTPLTEASGKKKEGLLRQLQQGELKPRGEVDWQPQEVTGLLLTQDRKGAYPVIDSVAVLLPASYLTISS